ncbi:hypothetical protein LEP1GSC170_0771 [Leptospira interrogans serovar Bataviae str. HAI135]|nr:hypothetical protein LEP1GSC170_0771 [Leptospira interrogans serovar Bataviae str. HAI135]
MLSETKNGHILELYIETNEVNSLNVEFFKTFSAKLDLIAKDLSIKTVILTSKNEKFFLTVLIPKFLWVNLRKKSETLCVLLWRLHPNIYFWIDPLSVQ